MIGGGTGPADGTNATTCTPGVFNMSRMLESIEDIPMNFGFLGKGNDSHPSLATQMEQIEAGACGLKDHEDWGTTAAVLDASTVISILSAAIVGAMKTRISRLAMTNGRSRFALLSLPSLKHCSANALNATIRYLTIRYRYKHFHISAHSVSASVSVPDKDIRCIHR